MDDNTLKRTIEICKAIESCNLIALKIALKEGGKPQLRIDYNKHFTPWKWAYSCGDSAVISYLLEFGADPNTVLEEVFGQTPIFGAILCQNKDVIRVLVEGGASLEIVDDEGFTPLYTTLEQSEKCRDLIPYLLELGADMRVGIKKLDEAQNKDHDTYQSFCDKVKSFLEECDENCNFEVLEKQIPRILEASKHLPKDLIKKAEELKEIYLSDGDDSRGQESEGIQPGESIAGSVKQAKPHNGDKIANIEQNLEESGSWEDLPSPKSPHINLIVHHSELEYEYDVCFKRLKGPLFRKILALIRGSQYEIQSIESPNLVELQRQIMLETTEIINYSLEREHKQLLHEEEEKKAIGEMGKRIQREVQELMNNFDSQNPQEKKQNSLLNKIDFSQELSSLCERADAYSKILNENKEKILLNSRNPSISHNENKAKTSFGTNISQEPEQKRIKEPIEKFEILYLGRPSNNDFSSTDNHLSYGIDMGLFKAVRAY